MVRSILSHFWHQNNYRPSRFVPRSTISRDIVERGTNRLGLFLWKLKFRTRWVPNKIYRQILSWLIKEWIILTRNILCYRKFSFNTKLVFETYLLNIFEIKCISYLQRVWTWNSTSLIIYTSVAVSFFLEWNLHSAMNFSIRPRPPPFDQCRWNLGGGAIPPDFCKHYFNQEDSVCMLTTFLLGPGFSYLPTALLSLASVRNGLWNRRDQRQMRPKLL